MGVPIFLGVLLGFGEDFHGRSCLGLGERKSRERMRSPKRATASLTEVNGWVVSMVEW